MYGAIMRLDSNRQKQVNPEGFLELFSKKTQRAILHLDGRSPSLNSSRHEPDLFRYSIYPSYFDATMLRTLFYSLKMHGDLPKMTKVFINKDQSVVFEFEENVKKETAQRLQELLQHLGHVEFTNPEISGKRVGFDIETESYEQPTCDSGNVGDSDE